MRKIITILFMILFSLTSCSLNSNLNEDEEVSYNKNFKYDGIWKVNEYINLADDDFYSYDFLDNIMDSEIYITHNSIKIFDTESNNIKYKLKVVDKKYVISYEYNLTAERFMEGKEKIDIISVIDNNNLLCEFLILDNGEIVILYKSLLLKLEKISDDGSIKQSTVQNNEYNFSINQEVVDENVGVMIGLKKNRLSKDGEISDEEYRTIWIPYKNKELGTIYEKENIIFPRMNGLWMLSKKVFSSENFYSEYFQVVSTDGKNSTINNKNTESSDTILEDNTQSNIYQIIELEDKLYKTIDFVGNDYIGIEKYQGDNFKAEYNNYQIIPVDNINSSDGVKIQEIFNEDAKIKYEIDLRNSLGIASEDIREIDYSNFTMKRSEGKWVLKGKFDEVYKEQNDEFTIYINPNKKLINFNSLVIPWKNLKGEIGFLKDAVTSPNAEIAIIQFKDFLTIYEINNGTIQGSPVFSIPIDENEEIIMAEWCSNDYIDRWEKAFKDGKVIE